MLQFITDGPSEQIPKQAEAALKGGIRWVQLRMKDATTEEILATGAKVRDLCTRENATFIINDSPQIAKALGADGVHLGKEDMAPKMAREYLGPDAIIGATANSAADVRRLAGEPIDYLGIGPYRFTATKKKLAPVLGKEGISEIIDLMNSENINLPYVVIGGITAADLPVLHQIGVTGVAVSSAIARSSAPEIAAAEFVEKMKILFEK